MNGKLTVGSMFSGIGGLELGLERTGRFETRWQCEINDYARRVLAKNWPGLPIYNDIKELYESEFPELVDVLCGGFPCQPFSTAGKRRGEADERFLWPEFVRVVREVRPRWVIAENVPGLLTIDAGRVFGRILWDLAECGYDVEWDTISAASVGALHPRNRIFIVGRMADPEHFGRDASEVEGSIGAGSHCHQAGTVATMQPSGLRVERSPVADAEGGEPWEQTERQGRDDIGRGSEEVGSMADPDRPGCFKQWGSEPISEEHGAIERPGDVPDTQRRGGWSGDVRRSGFKRYAGPLERGQRNNRLGMFRDASGEWWAIEPDVGRVVNGVPSRVDRLRCLGNAVVPQCAEYIGELILEWEGLN